MLDIGTVTFTVKKEGDQIVLNCRELEFTLKIPANRMQAGQMIMANLPAVIPKDRRALVVTDKALELIDDIASDPKLAAKIRAVTEAHKALEGN